MKNLLLATMLIFTFLACKKNEQEAIPFSKYTTLKGRVLSAEDNKPVPNIPIIVTKIDKNNIYSQGLEISNDPFANNIVATTDKNGNYKIEFEARTEYQYLFYTYTPYNAPRKLDSKPA